MTGHVDYGRGAGHWGFFRGFDDGNADGATFDQGRAVSFRGSNKEWRKLLDCPDIKGVTAVQPASDQLSELFALPGLRRLKIRDLRHDPPTTLGANGITELVLSNVTDPRWLEIPGRLPDLKSLMISGRWRSHDFSRLGRATGLRCLVLEGAGSQSLRIDNLDWIAGLPELSHVTLNGFRLAGGAEALIPLTRCPNLTTLWANPWCLELDQSAFLHARMLPVLSVPFVYRIMRGGIYQPEGEISLTEAASDLSGTLTLEIAALGRRDYEGPAEKVVAMTKALEREFGERVARWRAG